MEGVSKQQLAVYVAAVIAVALIGARYLYDGAGGSSQASGARSAAIEVKRSKSGVQVYVTGAVKRPGVYELPGWARLDQAVRRAGGATERADLEAVNLAARVSDGQQVVVPRRGAVGADGQSGPLSLNTATLDQLDELEGVGPATAQKILDWRTENGGFRSVDDLKQIGGIGPKRFESLKSEVRM